MWMERFHDGESDRRKGQINCTQTTYRMASHWNCARMKKNYTAKQNSRRREMKYIKKNGKIEQVKGKGKTDRIEEYSQNLVHKFVVANMAEKKSRTKSQSPTRTQTRKVILAGMETLMIRIGNCATHSESYHFRAASQSKDM